MDDRVDERTEGLVGKAVGGDPGAFSSLFERLRRRLEVWIELRMGSLLRERLAPEDVLQETFVEAHRSLATFVDRGPGSFQRWLFSVAENRLRDLHKFHTAQKRDAAREIRPAVRDGEELRLLDRLPGRGPSPSSGARFEEDARRLAASIERLPEPLRDILVLRGIEERTYADIATALARPESTVRVLYCRALRALRDDLATRPDA